MCGRFSLSVNPKAIAEQFGLEPGAMGMLAPRYNIAPTQPVAVVRLAPGRRTRQWTHLQWGLVPSWAKDPTIGQRMINARAETLAEKPSFRSALKWRRCLVPASGFYEWRKGPDGKVPYHIHRRDHGPLAFAGLWEHWIGQDGSELETCVIVTTAANEMMTPLHARMPVILPPEEYSLWLDPAVDKPGPLAPLLAPRDWSDMQADAVSTYVNNARNEGPQCIEPSGLPGGAGDSNQP